MRPIPLRLLTGTGGAIAINMSTTKCDDDNKKGFPWLLATTMTGFGLSVIGWDRLYALATRESPQSSRPGTADRGHSPGTRVWKDAASSPSKQQDNSKGESAAPTAKGESKAKEPATKEPTTKEKTSAPPQTPPPTPWGSKFPDNQEASSGP